MADLVAALLDAARNLPPMGSVHIPKGALFMAGVLAAQWWFERHGIG